MRFLGRDISSAAIRRGLVTIAAVTLAFVWGLGAATYQIFPYQQIRFLKNAIDGDDGSRDPDAYVGSPKSLEASSGDILWGSRASVVMVGDSITAGGRWDEMFPGRGVVNRGVGGDTVQGVGLRLPAILAVKPRKAFLMVGVNDALFRNPADKILAHYLEVIDALRAAGVEVYIQSTLECHDGAVCTAETRDRIRTVNRALRTAAASRGLTFIDLNATMSDAGGLKPAYSWDGVHLNGEGYRAWRDIVRPYVEAP